MGEPPYRVVWRVHGGTDTMNNRVLLIPPVIIRYTALLDLLIAASCQRAFVVA